MNPVNESSYPITKKHKLRITKKHNLRILLRLKIWVSTIFLFHCRFSYFTSTLIRDLILNYPCVALLLRQLDKDKDALFSLKNNYHITISEAKRVFFILIYELDTLCKLQAVPERRSQYPRTPSRPTKKKSSF